MMIKLDSRNPLLVLLLLVLTCCRGGAKHQKYHQNLEARVMNEASKKIEIEGDGAKRMLL